MGAGRPRRRGHTRTHRCASLALSPVQLIFSYKSEKSLCGAGWLRVFGRALAFGPTRCVVRPSKLTVAVSRSPLRTDLYRVSGIVRMLTRPRRPLPLVCAWSAPRARLPRPLCSRTSLVAAATTSLHPSTPPFHWERTQCRCATASPEARGCLRRTSRKSQWRLPYTEKERGGGREGGRGREREGEGASERA
eukprot:COSAG03_NODE_1502_length_3973_cov_6.451988_1_plen_191_part_10